jgi:hypothetical protein
MLRQTAIHTPRFIPATAPIAAPMHNHALEGAFELMGAPMCFESNA